MPSQSGNEKKVLRIGILRKQRLVQDKLIKHGETVRVGESPNSTFVFPQTSLGDPEFRLFEYVNGKYVLRFTSEMRGIVASGGVTVKLDTLKSDPSIQSDGGVYKLVLSETDKGKITVDDVAVLFQFVKQPEMAQVVKPLEKVNFHSTTLDQDDMIFLGFFGLNSILGTVFAVALVLMPPPPEASFEEFGKRFADIVIKEKERKEQEEKKEEDKPDEDELSNQREEKKKEKKEEKAEKKEQSKKPVTKVDAAKIREQKKAALKAKMKIAAIGTRGDSGSGATTDAWEGGLLEDLSGVSAGDVALDGDPQGTRGGNVSTKDIDLEGDVNVGDASASKSAAVPDVDMSNYDVSSDVGDTLDMEGADSAEGVVRAKQGQLTYCYEEQLRSDPSLSGRVEIRWNVAGGRVTQASVVANNTGNAMLGQCIVRKIKRWRFPTDVEGSTTWPFVFRKR